MSHETDITQINASLKTVGDQLKAQAEQAEKDIKKHSDLSTETRAKVDTLLTQQGELQARLQTAEQLVAKLEQGGNAGNERPKSMGQQLVTDEGFEAFRKNPGSKFRMPVQAAITSDGASAGDLIVPQRVGLIQPVQQRLTIRDLLSWGRTTSNSIEYVKETGFTNNANVVGENPSAGKPQSSLTFELQAAPVATIAHFVSVTKQVLADAPMLQSYIDGRLTYGLKLKEEGQLLNGSGVGLNIDGIYTQATAYANPGVVVQHETRMDRLRLALLQAALAEYYADGIVINEIDWAAIELTKTDENAYLFANPRLVSQPGLWGRPVVATPSMASNSFLVGSFQMGAQGWDREDAHLIVSLEDVDNVRKNMVTLLVEERVGLTVFRPESFVKGDFTGVNPLPPSV
jgi:HK97 family phage major capsid protein